MDNLIEWTNKHAELYPPDKELEHLRAWQPTCKQELYTYFTVQIYIGITIESCIKDYWKDLTTHGSKHIVKKYIGLKRFHVTDALSTMLRLLREESAEASWLIQARSRMDPVEPCDEEW